MSRISLSLAALVGLVATLLVTAPAQAAAYGVSLTVSAAKADVGQVITLSGSVSGKKSAKKTLLVQRRVGSGAWVTIAKPKTNKKKQYKLAHRVSAVGAQQFRVVAPKKGKTTTGSSPVRAFTGWTWLWLSDQPHAAYADEGTWVVGNSTTVLGVKRPRSIEVPGRIAYGAWRLDRHCDASDLRIAPYDGSPGGDVIEFSTGSPTPIASEAGAIKPSSVIVSGASYLEISRETNGGNGIVIVSPRVHCSVPRLPDVSL